MRRGVAGGSWFALATCFLVASLAGTVLQAAESTPKDPLALSPVELQGKKIYHEGVSPSGKPMQALIGVQGTPVEASTLPCAGCHGADGLGRPEGAVKPPSVVWRDLTLSYGHRHDNGRSHPAFDEKSFSEALTYGKDPAGNKLDVTMPRYIMANEDIAALQAYLKRISTDFDPGVSPDRLRIGTLVPTSDRLKDIGQVVLGLLQAQIAEINSKGGIFGRQLELVVAEFPEAHAVALANAESLFKTQNVFAVVSPFTAGIDQEVAAIAERTQVPMVGPLTVFPNPEQLANRYTFQILSGVTEQGRLLAEFALRQLQMNNPRVAVLFPDADGLVEAARAVQTRLNAAGWKQVALLPYPPGRLNAQKAVAEMQQFGVQAIFFFGTESELTEMGGHIRDAIWTPYLLAPGARVARAAVKLPITFGQRVYLSYPSKPSDINGAGAELLGALQKKAKLQNRHLPAQIESLAALLVLEEAIKRAGRELSRARLLASLEALLSFETHLTPAISYGPNRRVGASGGYVVMVDTTNHQLKPVGGYLRVD
jgi:ABC-type branched-subunit amino acid transport system substrate-binding protein